MKECRRGVNIIAEKADYVRLNVDIPKTPKKRIEHYFINEEIKIKEFTILALENTLDDREGVKS